MYFAALQCRGQSLALEADFGSEKLELFNVSLYERKWRIASTPMYLNADNADDHDTFLIRPKTQARLISLDSNRFRSSLRVLCQSDWIDSNHTFGSCLPGLFTCSFDQRSCDPSFSVSSPCSACRIALRHRRFAHQCTTSRGPKHRGSPPRSCLIHAAAFRRHVRSWYQTLEN
jgi:hypothetical protein